MRARRVRLQADARRGLLPFRPRPRAPASPLFPYTTLFRSTEQPVLVDQVAAPPISYSRTPPIRVVETRAAVSSRRIDEDTRSEEHTSELQSRGHLVCRLLLEKKKKRTEGQCELDELTATGVRGQQDGGS